jgi:dual specificity protein kinase YAK1
MQILKSLTLAIATTYNECDSKFMYQMHNTPKRILTKLAEGVRYEPDLFSLKLMNRNDGFDNADGDYICRVGDVVFNPEGIGFEIVDQLGKGTFGQVLKCVNISDRTQAVAVKIVKNKPAYFQQGLVEVRILQVLNRSFDLRVVKMIDYFVFRKHLCIVFELLSVNLYEVIKHNNFRGLPFSMVRSIVDQLTRQLVCLKLCHVIHCDLKPENILLTTKRNTKIKLIDFGSAAFEGHQVYTYIQSRFYRSVDVILGLMPFTPAIDMWSLGCIVAELFLGLPLFPGHSEYDQLCRIIELLGPMPDELLDRGKNTRKFFARTEYAGSASRWRLRSREEYEEASGKKEKPSKKHSRATSVRELVMSAPSSSKAGDEGDDKLRREKVLSFIMHCLEYDPVRRVSPAQAISHPLFDESVGLEATLSWKPRPDEYCNRKLAEDPNSFIYHSGGVGDSGLVDVSATLTATPAKQSGGSSINTQPLQVHNMQRPVSSMADEGLAVSYRPALAKPPSNVAAGMSPSKAVSASPTTVLRGGIPFSPATSRLPPPTAYFSSPNQAQRPRSQSNIEPELVLRWP